MASSYFTATRLARRVDLRSDLVFSPACVFFKIQFPSYLYAFDSSDESMIQMNRMPNVEMCALLTLRYVSGMLSLIRATPAMATLWNVETLKKD